MSMRLLSKLGLPVLALILIGWKLACVLLVVVVGSEVLPFVSTLFSNRSSRYR